MTVDAGRGGSHAPWQMSACNRQGNGRSGVRRVTIPRRAALRGAVHVGIASALAPFLTRGAAQSESATPVPDDGGQDRGFDMPPNIRIASGGAPDIGQPHAGGAVRLLRPDSTITNFNPSAFAQDWQIPVSYLEPLVRADPTTLQPRPWLAERWEWREGGRLLILHLRDDVAWHDGSPLTADDAAFSYQVYRDDADSVVSGLFATVDAIEANSGLELHVRFRERDANWLFNAATLPVVSRRQYRDFWESASPVSRTLSSFDWKSSPPVGTGPWRVSDWDDHRVTFARFDAYWGSAPWLAALEVASKEGPRERLEAWEAGTAQIAWPVRVQELIEINGASGALYAVPSASVMIAAFNFANPNQPAGSLWTDVRVRRAASLAVNRERYAKDVFGGFIRWEAVGTVAQPWAHDDSMRNPERDVAAADLLLAAAGWVDYNGDGVLEDANGVPLSAVAILRDDSRPELAAVMARLARDLADVGFAITVEVLPGDEFEDRWITRRDYDLIAYAYGLAPGFTDFDLYGSAWDIRTNPAGWNPGGYANDEADRAIADFLEAVAIERQRDALHRLQRAVDDDLFALWLGFPHDLVLVADGVAGFTPDMAWQTADTWNLWRP
jgi:peptide/nickel transport system substrate-binding protein